MNVKITHKWLLEYLDTNATPFEIQKYLSLCGPSIESVTKVGDDYVYDIEITSNRIDMASVMGIAREASAILPRFGKKAKLIHRTFSLPALKKNNLKLTIYDSEHLTNRILAIILDGVHVADSPSFIKDRLEVAGIRSINNIVDITNYIMLEIGHPTHVFDYDRVNTGKFIFRKAKEGEKLTTLDDKSFTLKGHEVIIDDGTGRIIDLPSIMGTSNSVVTSSTKRVIFFIDNLNPVLVRKASMIHGIRTVAATFNEKSPDKELAYTALVRGVELINKYLVPNSMSPIIDVYPQPSKIKSLVVPSNFIVNRMGINISEEEMTQILKNLGFGVVNKNHLLHIIIPSWRIDDIEIKEDIVEEVARIYGYHKLPSNIQSTIFIKQPKDIDLLFELQSRIKHFLKTIGLHEVMNYSMISEKMILNSELNNKDHLKLKNTISEEIKYMRSHLLPSLYMNIKNNEGKRDVLKFFEIAKTYKRRTGELPIESYKLGIVVNTNFEDLKGIIDVLIRELNISYTNIKKTAYPFLSNNLQGEIFINEDWLVKFGQLSKLHQSNYQIKKPVFVAVFDFDSLVNYQKPIALYKPINSFAEIKLDLTIESNVKKPYIELRKIAFETSPLLQKMELTDTFKNKLNLRFFFSSNERNIIEEEAKNELEKIKNLLV